MARRREWRRVDGVLVLDKPSGPSSNQALQMARHCYRAAKAGHTGSLDPLASGVLPLCFGEATKFARFALAADKGYTGTFVLGAATDTGDARGSVLATRDASGLREAEVEAALAGLRGRIEQVPPMHSALKRGGQPLYKLARAGRVVARAPRPVVVHELALLGFRPGRQAQADVRLRCSKGTYVRSLAEELGAALGLGGHVGALRRTSAGPFRERDAVPLAALRALAARRALGELDALLLPRDAAAAELPLVELEEGGALRLRRGQAVRLANSPRGGMVRVGLASGEFLGIGEILSGGRLAPRRLTASH